MFCRSYRLAWPYEWRACRRWADFGFGNGKDVVRCCCKTDRPSQQYDSVQYGQTLPRISQMHKVRCSAKITDLCQPGWGFWFQSGDPMIKFGMLTLPETSGLPLKIGRNPKGNSSSNIQFSGSMLDSGRVNLGIALVVFTYQVVQDFFEQQYVSLWKRRRDYLSLMWLSWSIAVTDSGTPISRNLVETAILTSWFCETLIETASALRCQQRFCTPWVQIFAVISDIPAGGWFTSLPGILL